MVRACARHAACVIWSSNRLPRAVRIDAFQSPVNFCGGAPQQTARFQTGRDVRQCCAVDANLMRQSRLLKTRLSSDGGHQAVLNGRDVELAAFFKE